LCGGGARPRQDRAKPRPHIQQLSAHARQKMHPTYKQMHL